MHHDHAAIKMAKGAKSNLNFRSSSFTFGQNVAECH
jgi:hypothetical protein